MRKSKLKTVCIFVLTALVCTTAAFPLAIQKTTAQNGQSNQAQSQLQSQTPFSNGLILPKTYEQYLPLTAPSDVAVTKDYKAIADGKFIYVYNERTENYSCYEHTSDVTELQFSGDKLYFLDKEPRLHTLEAENPSVVEATTLSCSAFTIDSDIIYYLTFSGGFSKITPANLNTLIADTDNAQDNLPSTPAPAMATYNGSLYYTCEQQKSYLYNLQYDNLSMLLPQTTIRSLALVDGILYYTDSKGDFYAYDFVALQGDVTTAPLHEPISNCSAIASGEDGYIYVVQGSSIRQYSPQEKALTDYEISASSASTTRLAGATDLVLTDDTLFIADKGNGRISSYNGANGETAIYANGAQAKWLASDAKTAVYANETEISIVDLQTEQILKSFNNPTHFSGNVVGVTRVFETYYFLTSANYFYRLSQNEQGEYALTGMQKTISAPKLLTSDIHGNLYVACQDNKIYRFTETEFCDGGAHGTTILTILSATEKIAVDYGGNVYALAGNEVYRYEKQASGYGQEQKIELNETYVYGGKNYTPKLTSFAFSFENNVTYLLYDGNYLVQTDAFQLPTMRNIPVNDTDERIFANESAVFEVVKTKPNALLVAFDLQTLSGATYFPYLSYKRVKTETTALKIGGTNAYSVIAVFDPQTNGYFTYLVLENSTTPLPTEAYQTTYDQPKTGYLSNAVTLYKFPYLCTLLTAHAEKLPRGATVEILGEINELDHAYYHVSYTDETGATKIGYIPQAYAALFNGAPPQSEDYLAGAKESDLDAAWRLAYLVLGFAAICILTDYLLLRKKKDD